ncbi:hypothetical protein SISSUDRAFT_1051991, partial [Sistotremastrum suecicum HHB10207 ss-3]
MGSHDTFSKDPDQSIALNSLEGIASGLESALQAIKKLIVEISNGDGYQSKSQPKDRRQARDPGPREFLRATIEDVNLIQKEANSAFYVAIAEIAQRSNIYTEINQLPEEIMLKVLTDYIELSGPNVRRRNTDSRYAGYPSRIWVELRQVCRSWTNKITNFSSLWSSINLQWPLRFIDLHTKLSRSASLQVWCPATDTFSTTSVFHYEWLIGSIHRMTRLQIHLPLYLLEDQTNRALEFLSQCVIKAPVCALKTLAVCCDDEVPYPSLIPDLTPLNLRDLRLHYCWAPIGLPATLQTIHVISRSEAITVRDIYRVLSECPMLYSCIFDVKTRPFDHSPSFDAVPCDSPLELPRLRTLQVGDFPVAHIEWFYKQIVVDHLSSNAITIGSTSDPASPLSLPDGVREYASQATCLEIQLPQHLRYVLKDRFHHSINIPPGVQHTDVAHCSILWYFQTLAHNFVSVRRLYIQNFLFRESTDWAQAISELTSLEKLHVSGFDVIALLMALRQADYLRNSGLHTISLDERWSWSRREHRYWGAWGTVSDEINSTSEPASVSMSVEEALESFLLFRSEQGLGIRHLILTYKCDADFIERCRSFGTVVEERIEEQLESLEGEPLEFSFTED